MGIPKLISTIQHALNIDNVAIHHNPTRVDHLYIDVNNHLFKIFPNCSNKEAFLHDLSKEIRFMFKAHKPRKSIFLALDGVGPYGKIMLQRDRRLEVHRVSLI